MTFEMNRTMKDAMQLMQSGDLMAATQAIQRGLNARLAPARGAPQSAVPIARGLVTSAPYRVVSESAPDVEGETPVRSPFEPGQHGEPESTFRAHRFECEAGAMHYKLFMPAGIADRSRPLIVMLHGCTQSPDDFARGTRMNGLAEERGYVVAYPAQAQRNNAGKCWNWFRSGDQQRGRGEAALIAALTQHLVKRHRLDERRVYVAGLSAGGAMAAVLASTYPDVFAAIGVHSGLPFGAAHDLPSAFAAMKRGKGDHAVARAPAVRADPVPAIVFHGDRDTTVDPCNGAAVIDQRVGTAERAYTDQPGMQATVERGTVPGGRSYTRAIYRNASGTVVAEHWLVHGGGHAWFGGDPAGSYTDASGPDASEQMLRFFSGCARGAIN